ncbi:hypothetical protein COW36_24960 [bacterium (Candidatus Blackallbacteria) CG17_big_fil_post_rev_8_21_14_2_50_48_46]|uniref:Uncharacterized protein n=1 Tax=bacterium (Candidatus Blackallbacteria) CG17_big_fil_post_rev_8_21_14_2_50_48_46 TaxID=2014261 RepID=A0A2M7FWR6_9BACT|nr:MAG: hypothetical protein COW64_07965 [bacterium (Candidatus Blackallbacteria) CG18_big_fil_WC_8_21_14_2_50_49_26]PIW13655.1 MAG: hypothetical protein COW36_24960 [bacterium (Candidatus Blackallbacteria) CG17_big_fil_post_rev_8_21_14_2_50_48_46]
MVKVIDLDAFQRKVRVRDGLFAENVFVLVRTNQEPFLFFQVNGQGVDLKWFYPNFGQRLVRPYDVHEPEALGLFTKKLGAVSQLQLWVQRIIGGAAGEVVELLLQFLRCHRVSEKK